MMHATPITKEVAEKVADIVKQTLAERFTDDEFVFDPIIVQPKIDHYGDEYMRIIIVFDGDEESLDPDWTLGLIGRILPKMEAEGIHVTNVPGKGFVEKSEWEELKITGLGSVYGPG